MIDGISQQITPGKDSDEHHSNFPLLRKSGHFYFGKRRTFLFWVDKRADFLDSIKDQAYIR